MKISEKTEQYLEKAVLRAQKLLDKKALASDISEVLENAVNRIRNDVRLQDESQFSMNSSRFAYDNKCIKKIQDMYARRSKEQGNMTVGELIDHLSRFDKDRIVKIASWVECMTDAGTDLGGDADHKITDITDLESKIVISVERD